MTDSKRALENAEHIVSVLNEANDLDPVAIGQLVSHRVKCNDALADHPTIQVGKIDGPDVVVGLLGLINGLVGVRDNSWGYIAMEWDSEEGVALRFFLLPPEPT